MLALGPIVIFTLANETLQSFFEQFRQLALQQINKIHAEVFDQVSRHLANDQKLGLCQISSG
jgi:hypothetical protein